MTYIASTVCTTTDSNPVGLSIGQKSFYAKGYYFIFYANGAYIKYRSSSNGTSWGSEQAVSAMSTSTTNGFAICYDGGDYCYYARCPKDTTTLYYCRGTVNTDGTITWGSEVNTGLGYSNATRVCNIELDSSGYALIGYYRLNYPYVARNGVANSASWSSATTWQLNSATSSVNYYVQVCPLSSQKWLAIYTGTTNGQIYSRYYNGSTLGSETGICSSSTYYPSAVFRWTAVSDRTNDIVYFAENGGPSNYKIFFYKWTTSGWGSVETPRGSTTVAYTATPYLVYNSSEDAVYCFWYTSSVIYHRKRSSAGTWDSSDTTDYSDSNNPAMDYSNNGLYPMNGYAVLTYPTGTASPYNVKFYALQVVTIQNKSITDEAFTTSDVCYNNKPSLSIADTLGLTTESLSRPLRTMPLSDSVGLDDEMSRPNRKMPLSDVLGLSDTGYRNRTGGLSVSDALALVEALSRPKRTIPFYDTLTGSDVPYRNRTAGLKVTDTLGATTESVTRPKRTIPFTDSVSESDALFRNKTGGLKIADSLGYSDSFLTNKTMKVSDSMSSVDSAGPRNKTIPILEALSTGDSALVGKTLKMLDSLALSAESLKKTRKLAPMNDTLSASEIVRANKTLTFDDAFNLFEALYRNRNTKVTDALTLSDILLRAGTVKLADALGLADSVITGKSLTMRDTLAITDLTLANKRFNPIAESFRVVDSFTRNKRLTLAESLQTIDSLVNNKALTLIPDSVTQTQALKLNKTMKLRDYVNQADTHGVTFNGVNGYCLFDNAVLDIQDSFTLSIRFRVNKMNNNATTFILTGGGTDNPSAGKFRIAAVPNSLTYGFGIQQPGTWNWYGPQKTLELGRDYFATMQWDKTNQKFRVFIDGVQLGSDYSWTYTNLSTSTKLAIGALNASFYWTPCTVSDLSIWNGVRSQAEIQSEMLTPPDGTEANLIAYWPLNEGTGTTVTDIGPNQISGTLVGSSWTQGSLLDKDLLVNDTLDADELSLINKTLKLSDSYHYNDVSLVGKSLKFSDTFGLIDVASRVKRSFALSDSLAANDAVVRTLRQMKIADSLALADVLRLSKTVKLAESLGITDNATIILKGNLIILTDSLTASDLAKRTKRTIPVLDTMSVEDALLVSKKLILSDPFHYTDVMLLKSKSMKFSDAISITDTLVRNKKLPIADHIALSEADKSGKTNRITDSISEADLARRSKMGGLKVADAVNTSESDKSSKYLKYTDSISASEALHNNKRLTIQDAQHVVDTLFKNAKLTIQDSAHLADAIYRNKRLKLNDTIGLADSLLVMKHILLYDVATLTEKLTVNKKLTVQEAFALNDLLNTQRHLQILDSFTADDEIAQSKLFVHYHRLQAQISTISRALGIDTISNQLEAESEQKTLDGRDSQPDSLQGSDGANSFIGNP